MSNELERSRARNALEHRRTACRQCYSSSRSDVCGARGEGGVGKSQRRMECVVRKLLLVMTSRRRMKQTLLLHQCGLDFCVIEGNWLWIEIAFLVWVVDKLNALDCWFFDGITAILATLRIWSYFRVYTFEYFHNLCMVVLILLWRHFCHFKNVSLPVAWLIIR